MIEVDLESYLGREATPRDGVRLMQWSNYVRRRFRLELTAAEEMVLLERDTSIMGASDWWRNP